MAPEAEPYADLEVRAHDVQRVEVVSTLKMFARHYGEDVVRTGCEMYLAALNDGSQSDG